HKLGAHYYIDNAAQDVSAELQKLGGARVIIATLTDADAMSSSIDGLGHQGKLVILGVPGDPLKVPAIPLIIQKRAVAGWPSGTSIDSEDTLKFSSLFGVKAMIEMYPLDKASEAFERMMSGKARFRVVLETGA